MKITHQLLVDLFPETPEQQATASAFEQRYAAQQEGPSGTFSFPDVAHLREAAAFLQQRGAGFERFFRIEVEPDEARRHPAFFLGLSTPEGLFVDDRVNAYDFGDADIVLDYRTQRIVVRPRVRTILEPLVAQARWTNAEGTDGLEYAVLEVGQTLPEPLILPRALELNPPASPQGTWSVRGDGRVVMTARNIETLAAAGIATSHEVRAAGQVVPWPPRLLAAGSVCQALLSAGVNGVFLFPLLTESDPLAAEEIAV